MKTWTPLKLESLPAKSPLLAWTPLYTQEGNTHKIRITPGTVNGFIPSNWKTELEMTSGVVFVALHVIANNSGITGAYYELIDGTPTDAGDVFQQIPHIDFPTSPFKILLGVVYRGQYSMNYTKGINVYPLVWSTVEKDSYQFGSEPYNKYYIWKVV